MQLSAMDWLYPRIELSVMVDDADWPPMIGPTPAACTEKSGPSMFSDGDRGFLWRDATARIGYFRTGII
jgi:hypothetical protein